MADEAKPHLKVFLCHASADKPAVRRLYKRLVAEGIDAWLDQESLLPGQDWRVEIPHAVRESHIVVVCLSNNSITKEGYVQTEITFALDVAKEKPEGTIYVIPTRLEECTVPDRLSRWHWVDLFSENGYEQLMRSLRIRAEKIGAILENKTYVNDDITQQIDQLYTEGLAAFYIEQWDKAIYCYQAILRYRPNDVDVSTKLEEANNQKLWSDLYIQALDAQRNENWTSMVEILEKLTSEVADYKDASILLKDAQKKNRLTRLYEEARKLYRAEQWQAVIRVFDHIVNIDPNYQDTDGLLAIAQNKVAEMNRLHELNVLYARGVREMGTGHWMEAQELFEQIQVVEPNFQETQRLLTKVKSEIKRQEEKQWREGQIEILYEQARNLFRSGMWKEALDRINEIQKLDNQFADPDNIVKQAQDALAIKEREIELQNKIADMYTAAVRLMGEKNYQAALEKWQEITTLDPGHPDPEKVEFTSKKRLGDLTKSSQQTVLTTPIRTVIGLFIVATVVLVLSVTAWQFYRGLANQVTPIGGATSSSDTLDPSATPANVVAEPSTIAPTQAPVSNAPFAVMPGGELEKALTGAYSGTTVTVDGAFEGNDDNGVKFKESMKAFEEATGIRVNYIGNKEFEATINARVQAGDTPDVADFERLSLFANFVRAKKIVPVSEYLSEDWLAQQYSQGWRELLTVDGVESGVMHRYFVKSLVWYPKKAWNAADYHVPQTWDELIALTQQIADDGDTAWCIGIESGAATGWTATDWTEDLMLRTTSLENYDKWIAGELNFDSPEVKNAIQQWSDIWFNDAYVYGGRSSIATTFFGDAPTPMFSQPPKCWLHRQGNFIPAFLPTGAEYGVDYDFFYLPPVDTQYGKPFLVGGDLIAMFNDRPEVRALMEYLITPQSASGWLEGGFAIAPQKTASKDLFGSEMSWNISQLVANATNFRFDGSDEMPGQVGSDSFWDHITSYVAGSEDLDTAMKAIDASWPR